MTLHAQALDHLFNHARTVNDFSDKPVPLALLQQVYELARLGPTAFNCQPARFVFVTSSAAKDKLIPCLSPGNQAKTRTCPVNVIVGIDRTFFNELPTQFPQFPGAKDLFAHNAELAATTGLRNSSLTAGYFILAARALGLDCGPMTGFDPVMVEKAFFADVPYSANLIINVGYARTQPAQPRNPRLGFDQACRVV